ncbi:hypothetical protein HYH03_016823 [Edaphochlamys debaryana]|uniref:Uncharacterized protein n=1 Tax=Edaphochlamys debaryana TaxID=47281 RepID=A0A835XJ62_9CHLO|nr:hypothetical protein HYH03_016823 [Edaphochlamys debaryana]|eukprot:KAG2484409.1 hypothetical protein HYH03_016823 [Edaphochlamys debaryana]
MSLQAMRARLTALTGLEPEEHPARHSHKADATPLRCAVTCGAAGVAAKLLATGATLEGDGDAGLFIHLLQPGENSWLLEQQFGWPHNIVAALNPDKEMHKVECGYPLRVFGPTNAVGGPLYYHFLQPGEDASKLEEANAWPYGIIAVLNRGLGMWNVPDGYPLLVPGLTKGGHGGELFYHVLQPGEDERKLEQAYGWEPAGIVSKLNPGPRKRGGLLWVPGLTCAAHGGGMHYHYRARDEGDWRALEDKYGWTRGVVAKLNPDTDLNSTAYGFPLRVPGPTHRQPEREG